MTCPKLRHAVREQGTTSLIFSVFKTLSNISNEIYLTECYICTSYMKQFELLKISVFNEISFTNLSTYDVSETKSEIKVTASNYTDLQG